MFRKLASAGLLAAAVLGAGAISTSQADAQVLIRPAYYDAPAYGWRPPPPRFYGVRPYWRRPHYGPRFYGPPPPPRYYGWRPYY